ncbi:insulin-like growth factor-binding protein complex acid labile subunit [Coccinella septempunctata]|uniref:insulin-like growth factor-binding protein complex acid labile subunit n=1 Tax=Coccinella septempunctata TaxID=41139 RepID=UPI001D07ADA1|nr:insulin-like growth factor-binding protein complex acid labile subunit [Coccinella septempunctata]XP_044764973.1 insulin-like growth factor-binding protein complex acid labile subunit [Coccinella septempunctata]
MKILGLLSIIFILGGRDLKAEVTNTICLQECQCRNTKNVSLEISNCLKPIEVTSDFNRSNNHFTGIRFNDVSIKNLDINAFNSFTELEHLEFVSTEIKNMHPQAFYKAELSSLSFSNSKFWNLPNIQCLDLEELIITNCSLKRVPKFEELPSLTLLHLNDNKISAIKEKTFQSLDSLEEIYLNNNELTGILPKLFYFNPQLSILDLSHNLLSTFTLEGTMKLEILSLSNNRIEVFDASSSKNLRNLKSLDLSYNKLTKINQETFRNMPALEILNLGYNRLTVLDNNSFSYNANLEKLILDGNNFKTLPIFEGRTDIFRRIYNFSCKKCGLVSLSSFTFGSMPGLLQISLSDNNLEMLDPKAFALVSGLEILDLSGNKLSKLGGNIFSDNKELVEINLSGNKLKILNPEDFVNLKKLRKLDVSNAELISLWNDNRGEYVLSELEQLTISNNSIKDISTDDLKIIPNLRYIDFENNPLQCTTHLANLIKWLTIHEVFSVEGVNVLRRNEKLLDETFEGTYDHKYQWEKLVKKSCIPSNDEEKNKNTDFVMNMILQNAREMNSVPIVDPPQQAPSYDEPDEEDEDSDEDDEVYSDEPEDVMFDTAATREEFSLHQVTNIISVTSVFVITALVVLSAAVSITLVILKRHNTLNINNANLPRIKIPRWETLPSQKKHSGSVYRPLSEEILTPPTPKFNRYEFKANPTVHSSQP